MEEGLFKPFITPTRDNGPVLGQYQYSDSPRGLIGYLITYYKEFYNNVAI